ncbi:MAG TPA: ATP-binding protein [Rubrivivax sp.]|nr:histidine kinase [Burkholderiales bacterium]HNT38164.1 ATP-binding protein [Rubrivivax sp.]
MTGRRRRALALAAALGLLLVLLLGEQAAAPPAVWRITQAAAGAVLDDERLQPQALPHRWRDDAATGSGPATRWYRLQRHLEQAPDDPQALYVPMLRDNAAAYLNGRFLGQGGPFADPVARLGARPLWLPAPAALWQAGDNRLYLLLKADPAWRGQLPVVAVGPESALQLAWRLREALAVTLPQLLATAAGVLALTLGVLAAYRRHERAYAWLALAAAAVAAAAYVGGVVEAPLAPPAWDLLAAALSGLALAALAALLPALASRQQQPPLPLAATGLLLAPGLLVAATAVAGPDAAGLGINLALLTGGLWLAWQAWRTGDVALLLAAALAVPAVLLDAARLPPLGAWTLAGAEPLPLQPYALALLLGAAAWRLLLRFVDTLNAVELLNIDLEALVQARTAELQTQFERVRELERRQVVADERERLMRDMHDGVGGHLVSVLAMIEGGRSEPAQLSQAVRDALDDMRLMIDSLEPVDDDLNAVLASFRDRLAPRLRAAQVQLHVDVALLPPVPGLTPARVLHILRMLQEAVGNALRHGRARTLWIEARAQPDGVHLSVRDDGIGFDPAQARPGRGLQNLRRRSEAVGARLQVDSRPGAGCRLAWVLPLSAPPAPP